jgi:hypothetical protein
LSDGSTQTMKRLERPQVLFENGMPSHVFFACIDDKGEIYNIARPLK